ncbi:hypothetical protein PBAL39_22080 [Pedobacter sp. BAL39]|uniref:alpha/beta hydrolase family protein n=1 Tax=Pedobacter sp. BAL39 TaxID=391596 RepID=UPI000155927E|nr:alpha/beta hydrolase [Pedobacter sp. BAL39]EDM38807.1 hypothetical protein PBAL39_22080 [Pedobacter sp. BAL39]
MKKVFMAALLVFLMQAAVAQESEVSFKNKDGSITFGATLSVPTGYRSGNAVVLVSGTGKQDRDGLMAGHFWFKVIAAYLNTKGLVVLRVDDRGVGKTTGVYEDATTADFAEDALTALNYLKSRKDLHLKKTGMLGHSEGGVAISIAAAQSSDVAFLISLAGLATTGLEAQILQNKDIVAAAPISDYDKKRYDVINELMFHTAFKYADSTNMHAKLNEVYNVWKVKDDAAFKEQKIAFDHFRFPIYSWSLTAEKAWYRYFIKYDPADYLPKVKVPILAINGSKDLMVKAGPNLANWKQLPLEGGNKQVTIKEFPGLNHLLQHSETGLPQEYAAIKETIAPEVLDEIGKWLSGNKL